MTVQGIFKQLTALLLMYGLLSGSLQAALQASIDREYAYEGETVTLTISAESRTNLQDPDFSPLQKDFEVGGTSESTQISIFNGRRSDKHTWSVRLMPKKTGIIDIPSIQVGNESTLPLKVDIRPVPVQAGNAGNEPVFLQLSIDSKAQRFYVQQQIPVIIRLYYRHEISQGQITDPVPENALLERVGEDRTYSTTRNGQQYRVFERRYSLFAEKSGDLQVPSASFRGYLKSTSGSKQRNPHDFFSQFSAPLMMSQGQAVSLRSEPLTLKIEPHPTAFSGQHWLPAESLELKDSWTDKPPTFRVGQPVSRVLSITAKGLLASQLQSLELPAISSFRRYAEPAETTTRTDGQQVFANSRQTFTYIPAFDGEQEIPAVELPWWNVLTDSQQTARLPAWKVMVEADPNQPTRATAPPAKAATVQPPAMPSTTIPAPEADSKSPAVDKSFDFQSTLAQFRQRFFNQPYVVAAATAIGLLLLYLVLKALKKRGQAKTGFTQPGSTPPAAGNADPARLNRERIIKELQQQLKRTCHDNDAGNSCRILIDLARTLWPANPPNSLGAVAERLPAAAERIRELDRHLYAGDPAEWHCGPEMLAEITQAIAQNDNNKPVEVVLKPLYPSE